MRKLTYINAVGVMHFCREHQTKCGPNVVIDVGEVRLQIYSKPSSLVKENIIIKYCIRVKTKFLVLVLLQHWLTNSSFGATISTWSLSFDGISLAGSLRTLAKCLTAPTESNGNLRPYFLGVSSVMIPSPANVFRNSKASFDFKFLACFFTASSSALKTNKRSKLHYFEKINVRFLLT